MRKLFLSAAIAAMAMGSTASALTAQQKVFKEIVTETPEGVVTTKRVEADKITPGDRVVYALSYTNDKGQPAEDIVLTMPVPEVIAYIDGTADNENTSIMYSVDGGATFGPRETRQVVGEDGSMRPAKSEEITHVRWTMLRAVAAGETGELSFAGLLK